MRQISLFRSFVLAASAISLSGSGCGRSVSVLSTDGAVESDAPMGTGGAFGGNSGFGGSRSSGGTVGAGGTTSIGGSGGNATGGTTSAGGSAGAASGGVGGSGEIATSGTGGTPAGSGGTPMGGRSGSGGASGTGGTNASGGAIGAGGTSAAGGMIATGGSTGMGGATSTGGDTASGGAGSTVTTTPTFSPPAGAIVDGSTVSWSSTTPGATYLYCSGASCTPGTPGSSVVAHPPITVCAEAQATGLANSSIACASYTLSNGYYSLPPDRVTTWNPGLNAVGGIPTTYTQCGSTIAPSGGDDTSTIQSALDSCPAKHYVLLAAGTFQITGEGLTIGNSQVVLRGAGAGKTILTKPTGSNYPVIIIGTRWPNNAAGVALTADAAKEATQITLASASGFSVNQIIVINHLTDPAISNWSSDCDSACQGWFSETGRPVGQTDMITAINGNVLTLETPLHIAFTVADGSHAFYFSQPSVVYSGIENLTAQYGEGGDGGGGIHLFGGTAYSWVKNVESAMSVGTSINLDGTYRCVVRDSYLHDAEDGPSEGGGAYGLGFNEYASDNLAENNIIMRFNKVMVMRASGGGNVTAYNYVDDGTDISGSDTSWMESGINATHMTTPHYELFEGNQAFNADADNRWGNSVYITFFRNQLVGKCRTYNCSSNQRAAGFMRAENSSYEGAGISHEWYSWVGNVLGYSGQPSATYESLDASAGWPNPVMWQMGVDPGNWALNGDPQAMATHLRDGNYDYETKQVHRNGIGGTGTSYTTPPAAATLPNSLYLQAAPAFFGTGTWPWVDGANSTNPLPGTLPARVRYDAGTPNTVP